MSEKYVSRPRFLSQGLLGFLSGCLLMLWGFVNDRIKLVRRNQRWQIGCRQMQDCLTVRSPVPCHTLHMLSDASFYLAASLVPLISNIPTVCGADEL